MLTYFKNSISYRSRTSLVNVKKIRNEPKCLVCNRGKQANELINLSLKKIMVIKRFEFYSFFF